MAYILGRSKSPDYMTAIYDPKFIDKNIASDLMNGKRIKDGYLIYLIETNRIIKLEKFYEWDTLNDTIGVPLVNNKVLDILERECSGKFQAIPAILKLPNGEEIKDYFIINVTHKVSLASLPDCIKKPEYDANSRPSGFDFYCKAYNSSIINHEDLCKDSIIPPYSLIFISDRLRKIFKKEKIKGPEFYKNLRDRVILV